MRASCRGVSSWFVRNTGSILIYRELSTAVKRFVFGLTFIVFDGDAGFPYPINPLTMSCEASTFWSAGVAVASAASSYPLSDTLRRKMQQPHAKFRLKVGSQQLSSS